MSVPAESKTTQSIAPWCTDCAEINTSHRAVKVLRIDARRLLSVQVHHHPCNWEDPDAFIPVSASLADTVLHAIAKGGCRMTCGMPI